MNRNPIVISDVKNIVRRVRKEAKALEGKTVLIAGGSGFIGKYFLYVFTYLNANVFKKPVRIISIDNFITGQQQKNDELLDSNIVFIRHDIKEALHIKYSVDYVIHAAGIAAPVAYRKYPLETIEAATTGTKNLLEFSLKKRIKSFVFFSSSEIYGDPDPNFVPTPETYPGNVSCIGPRSCYDESKRMGETICLVYHDLYAMPVKIVRPFNVYGPGMRSDDYRVIPSFLTSALKHQPLPVHAGGNQTRTFCYISDAITAFLLVLLSKKNGEVYNVGNDKPEVNIMNLASLITQLFPTKKVEAKSIRYPDTYPQGDPKRRCPDLTKIRQDLGFEPQIELHAGLVRTLKWYKNQL